MLVLKTVCVQEPHSSERKTMPGLICLSMEGQKARNSAMPRIGKLQNYNSIKGELEEKSFPGKREKG